MLGVLGIVVAGLAVLSVRARQLHQWPGAAGPSRIEICSRTFTGPGRAHTADELRLAVARPIGSVPTWQGRRAVWGRHLAAGGAAGCGTSVYLQTGSNSFLGYALSGGP